MRCRLLEQSARPGFMHLVCSGDIQSVPWGHVIRRLFAVPGWNIFRICWIVIMHTLYRRLDYCIQRTDCLCCVRSWLIFACEIHCVHIMSQRNIRQRGIGALYFELQAVRPGYIHGFSWAYAMLSVPRRQLQCQHRSFCLCNMSSRLVC